MTLHQILIKNIDEWEKKKAKDVTGGTAHQSSEDGPKSNDSKDMKLNEEVKVVEYAPAIFQAIRKMDNVTDEMIQESLDVQKNRE